VTFASELICISSCFGHAEVAVSATLNVKLLQDSKTKFNMYTATALESTVTNDGITEPLVQTSKVNPCTTKSAVLGAYDLLMCGDNKDSEHTPDAMIFDAPSVYYEIRKRMPVWKHQGWFKCKLRTVGDQFFPSGESHWFDFVR
jgi:hypothetical protein